MYSQQKVDFDWKDKTFYANGPLRVFIWKKNEGDAVKEVSV